MSVRAIADVMEYSKTRNKEYAVLIAIANFYNDDEGCAWPGIERLARAGRCSVRGAWDAIAKLEAMGEVTVKRGGGNTKNTNRYIINFKNFVPSSIQKNTGAKSAPLPKPPEDGDAGYSPQGVQDRGRTSAQRGAGSRPKSAPNTLRTLSEPSREEKAASAAPPLADTQTDENPITTIQNRLREVFPRAAIHMTGAEMHELHSCLAVLDELTPEDWEAMRLYFNDADDWARTTDPNARHPVKLWPKNRGHFLKEAGETVEKIRNWWEVKGRSWWARKSKAKKARKNSPETEVQKLNRSEYEKEYQMYCDATGCTHTLDELYADRKLWGKFNVWIMHNTCQLQ